ncbi:response regulator [Nostoc punctiforme]|uniref:Multi-component transcriptional regulator, winged helix family n=1 Tax=Nostoc punctiforme (strain ATCC 29133 / PCC 73102) TaxID=63737 RepID=B2IXN9_NOSP7|nr:response regulator [Nostoc punctiforme]ACC81567.1 multi-component transcriptional regulator, winged helix family [Nostoc punctiforme PCC 73102]
MRILLVEDDDLLAQAVATALTKQNYVVDIAADGEAGWELVNVCNYDLILLDVILPKLDGISLCRQLRQEGYQMLILLLTAKDTKTDKVIGLDAGADDYVVKPFDFQELSARIRALLRRGNTALPPVLEWGSLLLDPSTCEVTYADIALNLTAKEFSLLDLFLRNNQRIFSRATIVDQLWSAEKDPPEENTIKSHIKSLRQKLKTAGANYDFIETVYGMGYRLKALSHEQSCPTDEPEIDLKQQQILLTAIAQEREIFKTKVGSRIAVLKQAADALRKGTLDVQLRQKAEQEAHKLAGSLGSFGFPKGSLLANEIEDLFQTQKSISQAKCFYLDKLLMELQRELEKTSVEQTQNLLLVISNDRQVVEGLVNEAENQGLQVKIATNLTAARSIIPSLNPDVVLLDLDIEEDSLKLLIELSQRSATLGGTPSPTVGETPTPQIPVLVFTERNNFSDACGGLRLRLEVARAGGRAFLQKSMPPNEILESAIQILQQTRITKARIMVVEDDPQILTVIQQSLETLGITLKTLEDSCYFWDTLTEFSPDLLILDAEMPYINGIELCQVVRNDPCWKLLPVVFVVDNLSADIVEQIFAIGADDCVSKPIVSSTLIACILNRMERNKLIKNA